MNTESPDPIFRGLDELAGIADNDNIGDRMPGIARKARIVRNRKRGAIAVASVAFVAAGVVGAAQVLPSFQTYVPPPVGGGPTSAVPTPASTPTSSSTTTSKSPSAAPSSTASKPAAPGKSNGLTIDLTVNQIASKTLGVSARIHGTAPAWTGPADFSGPSSVELLIDGEDAGRLFSNNEVGTLSCEAGTPKVDYDWTWAGGSDGKGAHVEVPSPGTYKLTVKAPYCGANGEVVANEISQDVTVTDSAMSVTDDEAVDIDGDGNPDQIKLKMPEADRVQGRSSHLVAEVTRSSGQKSEVILSGDGVPTIVDTADLNSDGVADVQIQASGESHAVWTVLTFTDGEVVAASPAGAGESSVDPPTSGETLDGRFQHVRVLDDTLVSWITEDAWDRDSTAKAKATLSTWVLEGSAIYPADQTETVCIVPTDAQTWESPEPC